ncbi:MAG: universal stress protein [Desulfobacterales bacterium]|nr:MAG: universal stress protein [Desulfobacterales bacterium]
MLKRILVALNFTPAGRRALVEGLSLARKHRAQLHIFHALDCRLKELDCRDPGLIEVIEKTKRRFESEVKPALSDFDDVSFGCLPAEPAQGVCQIARYIQADLIVWGSRLHPAKICAGRMNDVGRTVLAQAPCPVLMISHRN